MGQLARRLDSQRGQIAVAARELLLGTSIPGIPGNDSFQDLNRAALRRLGISPDAGELNDAPDSIVRRTKFRFEIRIPFALLSEVLVGVGKLSHADC